MYFKKLQQKQFRQRKRVPVDKGPLERAVEDMQVEKILNCVRQIDHPLAQAIPKPLLAQLFGAGLIIAGKEDEAEPFIRAGVQYLSECASANPEFAKAIMEAKASVDWLFNRE